jgi:hypothetical protein
MHGEKNDDHQVIEQGAFTINRDKATLENDRKRRWAWSALKN